ncbi:lytic transglycosylase domain-containing protein [Novosphingobium sp. NBM11]|uniref:lytic transglycosylase domain-containing protein n=1 Tax=Novosphingobium sp. NBM11 TaxID=2596914 RepID=UPI0019D692C4|nr:lytic transglycosylase domain-containing protein [Novosphingobium sp. NBM11]
MNHTGSSFFAQCRLKSVLRAGCLGVVFAASAATPLSAEAKPPDTEIARCIARAAGGKSWLEKTLWGLRDQEGGWVGAEILNTNGSHDLGPLQINSWWVPKIAAVLRQPERDVRTWLKSDACFNADVARWIFLTALRSTGDYWAAIGVYHSPTAWRQRHYALSVADHLTRRFGPAIFSERPVRLGGASVATTPQSPDSPTNEAKRERMLGFGVVARSVSSEVQD